MEWVQQEGVNIMSKTILLLIGASASGKTVIGKYLQTLGISELISHTTRPIRQGEIPNKTYYYITKEEFVNLDKLERTYYAGNYYCLSRQEVERHNEDLVYCIVDQEGVKQIRTNYDNVVVINIGVSYLQMFIRMLHRKDKLKDIIKRIKYAITTNEIKKDKQIADYYIKNNNLNTTKEQLSLIVNKLKKEV